jgi:4-amino-4-deoxy-L-arabinose transferase
MMHRRLAVVLYGLGVLAVALAFQGSRGIFEPDEGRCADIAVGMLRTGDWWVPRLQGMIYLDKPPAVYWSAAAGLMVFGVNEWGARIGQAVAFAVTALLVGAWAGRAWGERLGRLCGIAYATTLLPTIAANTLTPDTLLTLWTTATSLCYWKHRGARSPAERWCWALAFGCSVGLAVFSKGTAALVMLAAIAVHVAWERRLLRFALCPEIWAAALLAAAIGSFWFVGTSLTIPGAASYFYDNQVAGRLWTDTYSRNPQWWSPFKIYGTALLVGSLPWSLTWLGLWRPRDRRARLAALWDDALVRYLALAAALPIVVFGLASSRLPLYILPVFPFLVMLTISLSGTGRDRPRFGGRVAVAVLIVVGLKAAAPLVPVERDSRVLAGGLRRAGVESDACVVTLGMRAHGLSLYGFRDVSWLTIWPDSYPTFEPPRTFVEDLPRQLARCGGRLEVLLQPRHRAVAEELFAAQGLVCTGRSLVSRADLFNCVSPPRGDTPDERR